MSKVKLIRDSLSSVIEPERLRTIKDKDEYTKLLKEKLTEEINELIETDYKSITEYADVIQVLYTMAEHFSDITIPDIERERLEKLMKRGGFSGGLVYSITEEE